MGEGICVCPKIVPDKTGIYHGVFVDDTVSETKIAQFEKMSGQKVDIGLKFLAFATGLDFPAQEARVMDKRGGAIFIKLEPWSWKGKDDKSFSLEDILAGKCDHLLKKFAEGAKKHGKPVFVSFGHEPNVPQDKPFRWYPWQGNPSLYKKAFQYVHDKINKEHGACNITWVWNPNMNEFGELTEYYPGDKYVDWIAVDGYNTQDYGAPWRSCSDIFAATVSQLESLNKPIMIGEFASDANSSQDEKVKKPDFLTQCIDFATAKNIRALVYFNKDKKEGDQNKEWAIDKPEAQKAYKKALQQHEKMLRGGLKIKCQE